MSNMKSLILSITEDIENSVELFGVNAAEVQRKDIKPEFAKKFVDEWFPETFVRGEFADTKLYVEWFKKAIAYRKKTARYAKRYNKKFTIVSGKK